jgi:predicted CXXCH cytochrome family protein
MNNKSKLNVISSVVMATIIAGSVFAAADGGKGLPVAENKKAVSSSVVKEAQYVGSGICKACHEKEFTDWSGTWHANMHRETTPANVKADFNNLEITYSEFEIETADKTKVKISPTIRLDKKGDTFTMTLVDKDNPANNQSYPVVYVLGGNWNQHFEARVGDLLFPTPMRWEVNDGQWFSKPFNDIWWVADGTADGRPKRPDEMPKLQTGDAKCDACHTTGFKAIKDTTTGKWTGNKAELGIACEKCHGPGSAHVNDPGKDTIINPARLNALQQYQLCGQCHSRVTNKTEKDLAFPQGFVNGNTDLHDRVEFWTYSTKPGNFWGNEFASKNRQQYNDSRMSKHYSVGVTCITCHNVHSPQKGESQLRIAKPALCSSCHEASDRMFKESVMASLGVNCTDCHMAKIASRSGATKKAKDHWDVSSHTFSVVMPHVADDFKMRSSCDACHKGEARDAKGSTMLGRQKEVKAKIEAVKSAIAQYETKGQKALEARDLLNSVVLDKSMGVHNYIKAMTALEDALSKVQIK